LGRSSKKRIIHSQVAIDKIAYDDKTGQTDVLRICLAHGLTEAVKMIRTKRAEFIRARGNKTSQTGRIYGSNLILVRT
jgi:hypothetical protein